MKRVVIRTQVAANPKQDTLRGAFVQRMPGAAPLAVDTFRRDVLCVYSAWMERVANDAAGWPGATQYNAARDAWLASFDLDARWVWVGDKGCNQWGELITTGPRLWPDPPAFSGDESKTEQRAKLRAYQDAVRQARRRRDGERRGRAAHDPTKVFDWLIARRFGRQSWSEMEAQFSAQRSAMYNPMRRLESRLLA